MITNGAAYLRSCLWSPGATNAQTFQSTTGMAMKSPAIIATFMYVQKASVGVVNTSFMFILVSGRWMNFIMGVVKYSAMPRPTADGMRLQTMRVRSSVR